MTPDVLVSVDLVKRLTHIAEEQGRDVDEVVSEALRRYLDGEDA